MSPTILASADRDLSLVLHSELPFLIAVTDPCWVAQFPAIFRLGRSEYFTCVDQWMQRPWTFPSETAVTALDQNWVTVITNCVSGVVAFLNQHDESSKVRVRPDTSLMLRGALVLKGEAKLLATDMFIAKEQLIKAFFPGAASLFPLGGNVTVGITTCSTTAAIYIISHTDGHFSATLHRDYAVQTNIGDRVGFIVDIFKILRWIASTIGPNSEFHLLPGIRRRTRNGHFVTWTSGGILKELHNPREHAVSRMLQVYGANLAHVEWGEAVTDNSNAVMVTRVGFRLSDALRRCIITTENAILHIRSAIDELHGIGLAHCDVVADNVFVKDGIAYLDDLEYLTPCGDAAPATSRWSFDRNGHLTAAQLDDFLFAAFVLELRRV